MAMPYKWELPGGKIDPGESAEQCLRREIFEELGIRIVIDGRLPAVTHDYPTFRITLHPFMACIETGEIVLHEHAAMIWLPPEKLPTLDWAEADLPVIRTYLAQCGVAMR